MLDCQIRIDDDLQILVLKGYVKPLGQAQAGIVYLVRQDSAALSCGKSVCNGWDACIIR